MALLLLLLLQEGPDVDVDCFGGDGFAPIHLAARGGHAGIAALLLAAGGFVDMQTLGGYSALHVAVEHGHLPLVALLLVSHLSGKFGVSSTGELVPLPTYLPACLPAQACAQPAAWLAPTHSLRGTCPL